MIIFFFTHMVKNILISRAVYVGLSNYVGLHYITELNTNIERNSSETKVSETETAPSQTKDIKGKSIFSPLSFNRAPRSNRRSVSLIF